MNQKEYFIGLVINPVAGMGGSVGLKGTDGKETLEKAIKLGAVPRASLRAREFIERLHPILTRTRFIVPRGGMGATTLGELGTPIDVELWEGVPAGSGVLTSGEDTARFVAAVKDRVDIIAFVGGDGTARDVLDGMARAGGEPCPVIGVPAGVKIHSGTFGVTPAHAALVVLEFLAGEIGLGDGEVMDIDEDAFRAGRLDARLYGYLRVPIEPACMQGSKQGASAGVSDEENKIGIAEHVISSMERGTCYFVGPGSTTRPILDKLGLQKTLLGVDAVMDGHLVGVDLNEKQILDIVQRMLAGGHAVKVIVTVIGAQGFLFGRGNLQFSPAVIRAVGLNNVIIVLTRHKVASLPGGKMRNDTRDAALDAEMRGLYRVVVDDGEYKILQLE